MAQALGDRRSTSAATVESHGTTQAVAILLTGSGALHLALARSHAGLDAAFFTAAGGVMTALAVALWCRPRHWQGPALATLGGSIALYGWAHVAGLPGRSGPTPVDAAGALTKTVELAAAAALLGSRLHRPRAVHPRLPEERSGRRRRPLLVLASLAAVLASGLTGTGLDPAAAATGVCPAGSRVNAYSVVSMPVDIVYNAYGDHNPNGLMYALESDHLDIKSKVAASGGKPVELVRPLVIRANRGDCLVVTLKNQLDRPAGFHVQGLAYDVTTADGSRTGNNPDSTVPPSGTRVYTYYVPLDEEEGSRLVEDLGDPRGGGDLADTGPPAPGAAEPPGASHRGSMAQGLYGTVNVLPLGSTWTDPRTGQDMWGRAGPDADIHIPGDGNDFREFTLIGWDEADILTKDNQAPVEPHGGEASFFGFNYRTEPLRNRATDDVPEASNKAGDAGDGEELAYSSWAHGDPATPVLQAYQGDPTKIRIVMAGSKETHVFHLHQHRWRNEPDDPRSTRIDSQSWSPGQSFTLDLEGGTGSQMSAGDSIFHCHLYPHFVAGFWGLLRSHDTLEDGTRHYPDGSVTRAVKPLPDRPAPPSPTAEKPGYPHYMPGAINPDVKKEYPDGRVDAGITPGGRRGHRPPQSPLGPVVNGVNDRRGPFDTSWRAGGQVDRIDALSPTETLALPAAVPGAPYADPCPANAPSRLYQVVLIQRDIVYNSNGWHDANGRMFVLKEDEAAVMAGTKAPEPLVIRANKGDCVNFEFTNKTPLNLSANAFQSALLTQQAGMHVHLVKFDVLASDGATNGWNYDQSALTRGGLNTHSQTQRYRWMVDTDIKSIFWHDHSFAAANQQHGVYAGMIQEPPGSTWRHPKTGQPVRSGWRADILDPNGPDFREFALFMADFAPVHDKDGKAVNPPSRPDEPDDYGVSAVNYANEPFRFRRSAVVGSKVKPIDPAHVYSSKIFGDPFTPIMEAYRTDPVKIRLFQGAFEEQHNFSLHGARWRFEPDDPTSSLRSNQAIGISEAFNIEAPSFENCGSQACKGDYLYRFNDKDSTWLGAWGIFRVSKFKQDGRKGRGTLLELPDQPRKPPDDTYNVDVDSKTTCGDGILTGVSGLLGTTTCLTDGLGLTTPPDPGKACPSSSPVRRFSVVAMQMPLVYNAAGDTEDAGMLYALAADEAAIRSGAKAPEPLMIRVNKGDCAEVTLTNKLPSVVPARTADDPGFEAEDSRGWGPSNRASIHASGLLKYEVNGSDGATVGKNSSQTVAPGESITQRWYADEEVGAVLLEDMGDQLNHRFRGLAAGMVVEPAGATYSHPETGAPLASGTQAVIRTSVGRFREFGLFFQDGLTTMKGGATWAGGGRHPMAVETEAEDGGDKGYNYRSAPFSRRLSNPSSPSWEELASVFSSRGGRAEPETPVWKAIAGDPVRLRLFGSQDQRRQQSFELAGHRWPQEPGGTGTVWRNSQDAIGPGSQFNLHIAGAGGPHWRSLYDDGVTRDHRYGSTVYWRHREAGLWGLFRVLPPKLLSGLPQNGVVPL